MAAETVMVAMVAVITVAIDSIPLRKAIHWQYKIRNSGVGLGCGFFCSFAVMKTLIIYSSQYGSTKRYAERLSEITGFEAVDYMQAKDIKGFDRIIFMGGLYAGGVLGLKKTVGKMTDKQEDARIATDSRCQSHAGDLRQSGGLCRF